MIYRVAVASFAAALHTIAHLLVYPFLLNNINGRVGGIGGEKVKYPYGNATIMVCKMK